MPVSFSRYVDITSGIGAGQNVGTRNLGGLIITNNPLCPSGQVITFTSASAVGTFFGTSSEEYTRAVFYFSYISKNITTPNQISFYFWNGNLPTGSLIFGVQATYAVSSFTPIATGDFTLTLGGFTSHITGINLSAAGSLAAVAASIQTAIRAVSANGTAWTAATVTYNATTGQFNLVSGTTGLDTIAVAAGTVTDVAGPLGWLTGATLSNGTAAQSVSTNLNNLIATTNNFGSFCYEQTPVTRAQVTGQFFTPSIFSVSAVSVGQLAIGDLLSNVAGTIPANTTITALGSGTGTTGTYTVSTISSFTLTTGAVTASEVVQLSELEAAANWNNSLNPNIQFMFSIQVSSANASSWAAAFGQIGGTTLTLASPNTNEYPEMAPMMMLGATNYYEDGGTLNYMFTQFTLTPSVTNDTNANIYDPLLINYYGNTQTAGQVLNFYQRGVMMGLATNPSSQNIYANEIWFKDALGAAIMTLLLAESQVPANTQGIAMILNVMQPVINQALANGTIEPGKTLTASQQLYVTQATGSSTAWLQVQNAGYWVNCVIQPYVSNGITQYKAIYTLIYSKDDVIRLVVGTDILI